MALCCRSVSPKKGCEWLYIQCGGDTRLLCVCTRCSLSMQGRCSFRLHVADRYDRLRSFSSNQVVGSAADCFDDTFPCIGPRRSQPGESSRLCSTGTFRYFRRCRYWLIDLSLGNGSHRMLGLLLNNSCYSYMSSHRKRIPSGRPAENRLHILTPNIHLHHLFSIHWTLSFL